MLSSLVCRELPYDRARKELRNKTFGGSDLDGGSSVQQTSDGGYIIAGYTYSYGAGACDVWLIKVKGEEIPNQPPFASIFNTGSPANPYPSISGTHTGKIIPSQNITVSKLYTYPCPGTGGHTESIELYDENGNLIASGNWSGYQQDGWHNITIHNLTGGSPYITLLKDHEYNYTIRTGSYPQIIHKQNHTTLDGSLITCTMFTDANGRVHYDWIPAIKLWRA